MVDSGTETLAHTRQKESAPVDMNTMLESALKQLLQHAPMVIHFLEALVLPTPPSLAQTEESGMDKAVSSQLKELAQPITISMDHNAQ